MRKKRPEICTCFKVSEAKFYLYHSTKIAKARPGFDDPPEHPSVQINSSSPRLKVDLSFYVGCIASKEYSIAVLSLRCLLIFSSKFVKSYGKLLSF